MAADELAALAALLADRSRARLCLALLDGRAWTASELARAAGIAPSTASEHLTRLVEGGLLVEYRQGRHRYLALTGPHIAELLESMLSHIGPVPPGPGLRAARVTDALSAGRTCYDHLAGRLGVAVTDALHARGHLDSGFQLTDSGIAWLADDLGVDPEVVHNSGRATSRACLDWTERRPHVGGAVGACILRHCTERQWIRRIGTSRAVRLTPDGAEAMRKLLDVTM